jgi:hypothetical protein
MPVTLSGPPARHRLGQSPRQSSARRRAGRRWRPAGGFGAVVELTSLQGVEAIRQAHPELEVFSLEKF